MSRRSAPQRTHGSRVVGELQASIHDIQPFLDYPGGEDPRDGVDIDLRDGQFTLAAVCHHADRDMQMQQGRATIQRMSLKGAVERVGRYHRNGSAHSVWTWTADSREQLRDYAENLDVLPCGCRAHVPDGRDAPDGRFCCNYCEAEHSRETIKRAMVDR